MSDTGKPVAIVTGAAKGIGQATAARMQADGWQVVGTDIASGPGIVACDVTKDDQVKATVEEVVKRHGRLDGLVNAAGAGWRSDFLSATDELWARTLEVNLMGTVRMCRAAIPHLRKSQHPARGIVNFTSQAAKTGGLVIGAPYSAAKAAVLCLTKSLAGEFGPEGIRVNAVAPGIIDTAFLDGVPGMRDRGGALPLRRIGRPEEAAAVVSFLMSANASYLTGECTDINGGLLMD
jgi:NAD(P)-dependent dehydrogenase (short-subunit alcohol dehydrogenase family)